MNRNSQQKIKPKKSLGQNFLINPSICQKIVNICDLKEDENILEIGPGKGAITRLIQPHVKNFYLVEKDNSLATELLSEFDGSNTKVFNEDFLKFDFKQLPKPIKVIGNLPYNVATPIIEKIILNRQNASGFFFMVQLEHGQRLVAKPNSKDYGSLSCFIQFYADIKMLFKIKPSAFFPPPKVNSCFMSITFPTKPKYTVKDEAKLFAVIRQAFGQRRKMIQNTLKDILGEDREETLKKIKINPKDRAENLSIEDFIRIINAI